MKIQKTKAGFLLMAVILLAGCAGTMRTHPDFATHRAKLRAVAVISAEVDFFQRTATINDPKPEFNKEVSNVAKKALENVLAQGQIKVISAGLSDSLLSADQELALSLTRVKQSFAAACDSIARRKKKTLSDVLSPEIGYFADHVQTEYLIFARGSGYQSSGGAKGKDIVMAGLFGSGIQWNGLFLEVALVDGNTGQVLWYNRNTDSDSNYKPRELNSAEELCRKLLKKLIGSAS